MTEIPKTRAMQLDVDEVRRLDHWCRSLRVMFPSAIGTLLVGSAITRSDYRDVDIRIVLPDVHADGLASAVDLLDLNMLLSGWGRTSTGLRIDCQVQGFTASQAFDGPRYARGLLL